MTELTIKPRGPFSLASAADFAGGFPAGIGSRPTGAGILMVFPIEGWRGSAVVDVWQTDDGIVHGEAAGSADLVAMERQVARSLSLDHDGTGWPEVGRRDPVIGDLQGRFAGLRPVCFYSAYEAATSFVIGQRIAMRQARVVKDRLADGWGDPVEIGGRVVHAFPRPQQLLGVGAVAGLSATKITRLHGLARAALDGELDTEHLRSLPETAATDQLCRLPGVGPWTASGILLRGCGIADALPREDAISRNAVAWAYGLDEPPGDDAWDRIADAWRPYRMWATVLLHVAWRRAQSGSTSYRQGRPMSPAGDG